MTEPFPTEFWHEPEFTTILPGLLAAHLLGDFVFQTERGIEARRAGRPGVLGRHALLHAVLAWLLVGIVPLLIVPVVIFVTHGLIDAGKRILERRVAEPGAPASRRLALLAADQGAHLLVIVLLTLALARWPILWFRISPEEASQWLTLFGPGWLSVLITISGAILAIRVGAIVIAMASTPFLGQLEAHRGDAGSQTLPARGFEKGGHVIGQLERTLIFLMVLTGHGVGVGILVAAKAVFRFGELREPGQRMEAEYILIGTLMSFAWALLWSWLTVQLLGGPIG